MAGSAGVAISESWVLQWIKIFSDCSTKRCVICEPKGETVVLGPKKALLFKCESPQRCKARLERHQRTADRAAKALAEKNMRDLVAQKEQAERNRLAEGLDAEVKRWCSGKQGNLRALLSTLQYILGSESGWQPVPLTEVITTAAVKRAYRKATLCVHPDKLQQRGATIQQKYICEKSLNTFDSTSLWDWYNMFALHEPDKNLGFAVDERSATLNGSYNILYNIVHTILAFVAEAWNKFNSEER
ncbi:DnaJ domain-containing protein [Cynara cardunculus var. scolymus]|uniref:DnaJ domain-containing protein n=1 Tax=Cynara cardunculus var. scolymus TaxID=59895 RepID=A0A124SFC6_CYNCS|nr:DnaJ domain-containing protein [Cynara cardunculus var. scolymus]